jgi:hypothetical protein
LACDSGALIYRGPEATTVVLPPTAVGYHREVVISRTHPLTSSFSIEVLPPEPNLPSALDARVEAVWQEERRVRGEGLFNGSILSLVRYEPQRLAVRRSDYRRVVAGLREPDLAAALDIRPLAVTGIVRCASGIVLGHRAKDLAHDGGLWEPAPAGSLDRLEPEIQLMLELEEELGIRPQEVTECRAIGLLENTETLVHDILFTVHTTLSAEAITAAHAERATKEYAAVTIVPIDGLHTFMVDHETELLPTLAAMLRAAGLPT